MTSDEIAYIIVKKIGALSSKAIIDSIEDNVATMKDGRRFRFDDSGNVQEINKK